MPLNLPESIPIQGCLGSNGHPYGRHTRTDLNSRDTIGDGLKKCPITDIHPVLDFIVEFNGETVTRKGREQAHVTVKCINVGCRFHREYQSNP